jgi:sec-independent protein translocase protein TatC
MMQEDTFISHLVELRTRLLRSIVAWLVIFFCLFPWARDLYSILAAPMLAKLPAGGQMIATEVVTPFFVPIKVTLMTSFLIALPYVLHQVWAFVAPGLYEHERKLALPLVAASTFLFGAGMAFAYFLVLPVVFGFITSVAPEGVAVMTDISKYLDFVLTIFMAFGITFQVPIAVIVLVRFGVVSIEKLKEARPYVIVGAFVIAAIVTPPDVISQVMLAVPMWLLFEAGIFLARFVGTRKAESDDDYRPMTGDEMERELDGAEKKDRA